MGDNTKDQIILDEPTQQDGLYFSRYVAALCELLFSQNAPPTPMTIAIYGSWGSGKSTLLKLLRREFDPEDNHLWPERLKRDNPEAWAIAVERAGRFIPIEFSPWSYQHESSLLVPLLLTLKEKTKAKVIGEIRKIAAVTGYYLAKKVAFPILKAASVGVIDAEEIQKTGEEIERASDEGMAKIQLADQTKLREMVEKVVSRVRGSKKRTLVILIDDLDRCHPPDKIVELLEQIKLFLHLRGCIFVLACDRKVVVKAIENKFVDQGEAYLEKFVQIPLDLPTSQSPSIAALVQDTGGASEGRYADREWQCYLEHISAALDNNPRRFKRFYNTWLLKWNILQQDATVRSVDKFLLAKWILLAQCSNVLADEPSKMLEMENLFPTKGRFEPLEIERIFGVKAYLQLFLQKDFERRFGTLAHLSIYTRLTGRDLDITREYIEQKIAHGEAFPDDLSNVDLSGAYLVNGNFAGKLLRKTRFSYARLDGAIFDKADLEGADLHGAIFRAVSYKMAKNLETINIDEPTLCRLHGYSDVPAITPFLMAERIGVDGLETTTSLFKLYASLARNVGESAGAGLVSKAEYWRKVASEIAGIP